MLGLIISFLSEILDDTLRKEMPDGTRRWDRMKIMQFLSFNAALLVFLWDQFFHGFRFETWMVVISFAFGSKLIDAGSKKIQR